MEQRPYYLRLQVSTTWLEFSDHTAINHCPMIILTALIYDLCCIVLLV